MKILGIFRGFPGLGRVVSGVSLLEDLKDNYYCDIKIISYLQGNRYLASRGYAELQEARPMDYCSMGLLPTNKMGVYIHNIIKGFSPDIVIIDGEPLIVQSLRISYSNIKIVALLNPADVDNPHNDKEAMDYFNSLYSMADMAIVHGLRRVTTQYPYKKMLSIGTVLRHEILSIKNKPTKDIYCVLGGGTVNVGRHFASSTIRIAELCQLAARSLIGYTMHIICSSSNIYDAIIENNTPNNVILHNEVLDAKLYYNDACLIITRSGRNTLSELAYLGIPTISFVTGDSYRKVEQEQNIINISADNIKSLSLDIKIEDFIHQIELIIAKGSCNNQFENGNSIAIQSILNYEY